jgi:hypothetical protein
MAGGRSDRQNAQSTSRRGARHHSNDRRDVDREAESLRSSADSLGLILGHAVARRFLQLRGADLRRLSIEDSALSAMVLRAVRDMYVVLATSDDPFPAMDRMLELEEQFAGATVEPGSAG